MFNCRLVVNFSPLSICVEICGTFLCMEAVLLNLIEFQSIAYQTILLNHLFQFPIASHTNPIALHWNLIAYHKNSCHSIAHKIIKKKYACNDSKYIILCVKTTCIGTEGIHRSVDNIT